MMAMEPERSKPLHNFSMPQLKWGNKRFLKCVKVEEEEEEEIEAVREKLMIDLRVAADKLKVSIFENPDPNPARPWNLRTRRASCSNRQVQHHTNLFHSPAQPPNDNNNNKFCVSLSKEEIEQDFWALVRTRPPRRPKKRPRILQKQLDTLFPGLWLTEVTAECYKVPDAPE